MDHAAATPVDARVIADMAPFWDKMFANPGAIHREGVEVVNMIGRARANIAGILGIHADEVVFTGSATESVNLALLGTVRAWQEMHPERIAHIIVSAVEHDAVLEPVYILEQEGVRVTRIPVDAEGIVLLKNIEEAITEDTVIISVMYANNEIGTIQPIRDIAKTIRKWKKNFREAVRTEKPTGDGRYPLFHTDACQATNYLDMHVPRLGVDLLTLSAGKIYGPKGVGLLVVTRDVPLRSIISGGSQEGGRRAGTENVPGVIGLSSALTLVQEMKETESQRLTEVRDHAMLALRAIPGVIINGSVAERLPNNVHFSLPGVDHEFLAIALDAKGIAVATKSACNESDAEYSHVLLALNESRGGTYPTSGIRLSFGRQTTIDHVDRFIEALGAIREQMLVSGVILEK